MWCNVVKMFSRYLSAEQIDTVTVLTENLENKKQVLFDLLLLLKQNSDPEDVLLQLKMGLVAWNHPSFKEITDAQNEIFSYIECPYEVVEGMFTCPKCENKKTISYAKQTRSADEGMSTFVFCANKECRHAWMYRG